MSDDFGTAMQLLLGERPSVADVQQAAAMLQRLSDEGNGEASERCALIAALGSARPPNWDEALDLLAKAADQGSSSAQAQLLLLLDNECDPDIPANAHRDFWSSARAKVPLDERMRPGETQSLSDAPRIRFIRDFITPAEARWMVGMARERLAPATVFDQYTGGQTTDQARDNSFLVLSLKEMNVLTEVFRQRISAATKLPTPLFEPSQVLHYAVGQRFTPHHDFLDPANPAYRDSLDRFGQRIATFLIYLNDGYDGGETSFPRIDLKFRAKQGDALFFANVTPNGAPDLKTLHAGLPPTRGEKWLFSQWIRDRFPGA
jgi:hypothetical protein